MAKHVFRCWGEQLKHGKHRTATIDNTVQNTTIKSTFVQFACSDNSAFVRIFWMSDITTKRYESKVQPQQEVDEIRHLWWGKYESFLITCSHPPAAETQSVSPVHSYACLLSSLMSPPKTLCLSAEAYIEWLVINFCTVFNDKMKQ